VVDYSARIPVSGPGYTVKDAEQKPVDAQVGVFKAFWQVPC